MSKPHALRWLLAAMLAAAAWPAAVHAQDRAELDRTQVIGNRELPKVLYIVPWKKPLAGELSGRPVASVLDEALAPIDRDVHRRELGYAQQLQARGTPAPSAMAPATGTAAKP